MKNFKQLLDLAQQNKSRRTHEHKGATYYMLNSNETYPALIMDAEYIEDESVIVLHLAIIKGLSCIERFFKFKVFNGSSARYDAICEILGTNGNPSDLISKCFYMHIERNGDFQNLRVEAEMDKNEFEEMISGINSKSNKGKKKADSKDTPYVKSFFEKNEEAEEEDEFEEQYLDDEEDEQEVLAELDARDSDMRKNFLRIVLLQLFF